MKRGSISVFLVIVFACFVTVTAVLFAGAKSVAGRSMADASLQLAGRSVLSEYDRRLLSDYGLLAFRGDESRMEDAIVYYTEASIAPKDPLYALFRSGRARTFSQDTRVEYIGVNLKEYSLFDLENFEDQIRTAALPEIFGSLAVKNTNSGSAKNATSREDGYGRTLRNKSVIASLPSNGFKGPLFPSLGDTRNIPRPEDFLDVGAAIVTVSEYALSVFGNHVEGSKAEHFFGNEIEYLIVGGFSDKSNYSNGFTGVKDKLRLMRFGLNDVALIQDKEKMASVEELALIISLATGENSYEAVKNSIILAWVAAETGNDLVLLEHGDKVSLMKTPSQWATQNIVDIFAGWTGEWNESEPIYASDRSGLDYRGHLRMMLYILDRETKLLRMMDLMQINLKGTYSEDFLMREHYIGFRFDCIIDGEHYAYTEKY